MNRIKNFFALLLLIFANQLAAQNFSLVDVDVTNFPLVKARVLALNPQYKSTDLISNQVTIFEDNQPLVPIEFKAPKSSVLPTSIVLVLDVSASMDGFKFEMLKKTAKAFIARIPLELSEVAIASFNHEIMLQCDFTHNSSRLNQTIDNLTTKGGTDIDQAFLNPYTGALNVARMGKYRKVVVLLTDGMSKVKPYEVANRANLDSTIVNCVTIDLPISEELITITRETRGRFYSNLLSEQELDKAYEKIYAEVQINTSGTLVWKSNYSCQPNRKALIKLKSDTIPVTFTIPTAKIGSLEVTPNSLIFPKVQTLQPVFKPVIIKGNYLDLNHLEITNSNPGLFGISAKSLPITADANENKIVQFSYTPVDTLYALSQFTISQKGCPDVVIDATTLGSKKLEIITPKGGESYPRGMFVPISWKGIDKAQPVDFFYQIKGNDAWIPMLNGKNYSANWPAPSLNDSLRILGQITNNISLANLLYAPIAFIDDAPLKQAIFNAQGTEVLTLNANGILKNWDAATGILNHTFENTHAAQVMFFPDYNRIISYTPTGYDIYTNRNGLLIKRIVETNFNVKASLTHFFDQEFYTSLANYTQLHPYSPKNEGGKLVQAPKAFDGKYYVSVNDLQLEVFEMNSLKKWWSLRLDPTFKQAIVGNTDFLVIDYKDRIQLYNLTTKQLTAQMDKTFLQFNASGNHFLTQKGRHNTLYSLQTGDSITSYPKSSKATFSKNGAYVAYSYNDSLIIIDLNDLASGYALPIAKIEHMQFYPQSTKLAVITQNQLKVLNLGSATFETETPVEGQMVKFIDISPNGLQILITTAQVASLWEPKVTMDSDTTPYFRVYNPKPTVTPDLNFGNVFCETAKEVVFPKVIVNKTLDVILIDSIYLKSDRSPFELVAPNKAIELKPNGNAAVELRFVPRLPGLHTDTLVVLSGNDVYFCKVNGRGISQQFTLPTPRIIFDPISVFQSSDSIIPIIVNTGTEELKIEKIRLSGEGPFLLTLLTSVTQLKPTDTLWVKIQFNPDWHGRFSSNIDVLLAGQSPITATTLIGEANSKRTVTITGRTLNRQSGKPMEAQITWNELESSFVIGTTVSSNAGVFSITMQSDLNYSITAEALGFYASSENIDLSRPQFADTLFITIWLSPIIHNAQVLLNNTFFDVNKADLLDLSKPELNRLGQFLLTERNLDIVIIGHTDDIGEDDYNLELSKLRANSVRSYLIGLGINKNRIHVQYFGERNPIAENITEEGRKANRRVEIRFLTEPE